MVVVVYIGRCDLPPSVHLPPHCTPQLATHQQDFLLWPIRFSHSFTQRILARSMYGRDLMADEVAVSDFSADVCI